MDSLESVTDIVQKSSVSSTVTPVSGNCISIESSENPAKDVVFLAKNDNAITGCDMEASAFKAQAGFSPNDDVTKKEYVQLQVTHDDATSDMLISIHNGVFSVPLHTLDSMGVDVVADDYLSIDGDDSRVISFGPQPQDGEGQDDTLPLVCTVTKYVVT